MENKISKNFVDKLRSLMPKDTESVIQTSMASNEIGEEIKGGVADNVTLEDLSEKHGVSISHIVNQLSKGIKVEMEHTERALDALDIAIDHIFEDPNYYTKLSKMETKEGSAPAKDQFKIDLQNDPDFKEFKKNARRVDDEIGGQYSFGVPNVSLGDDFINKLKKYARISKLSDDDITKMETKEATSSSSSGSYESPSFLAKSTSKKDWRGASKTQIPGGKFVSIKKKCNKFPYCNQGDIKALNLYENPSVNEAIKRISTKYGIGENVIKSIIQHEYENIQSKDKK